jgi:predicted helicase
MLRSVESTLMMQMPSTAPYELPALKALLLTFRDSAVTEREKGTYFEELIRTYLRNEDTYRELYSDVWTYAEWAKLQGLDQRDAGIDLVAKTRGTDEFHAIQCKLYAEDYRLQKSDIDSFFTASGKKYFARRIIVSTTNHWSEHAEAALIDQHPPVSKIDLHALENSRINWSKYKAKKAPLLRAKKELRPHQKTACALVTAGLKTEGRGKLIMACGTGKTFTSLKVAEELAGKNKRVLFLVPSLSLMSQTLTEWTQESDTPLCSFAVCSDGDVGKKRSKKDQDADAISLLTHELAYPATTNAARLAEEMKVRHEPDHMSVVFSTYHSIDVISRAQKDHGLPDFDLIVCDEAHRTTGATFGDDDESAFVKVHDADFIRGTKRLYMTATPRIYGDAAKATAERDSVALCSMDDEALYGKQLYVITFSEAVKRGLLVDYKVIVLSVEEAHINRRIQELLKDENNQLKVDDAARIIGCWKALSKQGLTADLAEDSAAMKRAVAFCQVIETQKGGRVHKVSSKNIAGMFQAVVEAYQATDDTGDVPTLRCEAAHVDGGMNASEKEVKLDWLKEPTDENTCRILSNVRCLSEGVDVPALDAVLFLTPRNSQVDVVQSVGRVMRNAPGKKRGYIVLPVVVPAGADPKAALDDNKTYRIVWQVLQALRSHDDRFDAMVNKLELIGKDPSKMEVIAITDKIEKKPRARRGGAKKETGRGSFSLGTGPEKAEKAKPEQIKLEFEIGEIERAIYAKLVQKVGNRHHWEDWANDIAKIAATHVDRIQAILENPANAKEREAFENFAAELRDDLNDSISNSEIVEMLAQHLITKPVFDALFSGYSFAQNNPISTAMQDVLDALHEHHLEKEADTLTGFYESVKMRAEGIESAAGKQKIVVDLYDKFFRNAFPKMSERLGIVYTPVEVVDFIINSVNHLLQEEFGQTLGSKGVHILDPFAGTGTFITRLLEGGLIRPEELPYKYKNEIHANEIVLLAYYIAAINIEASYHSLVGGKYVPFEGICLTDTFQLHEKKDLLSKLLVDNSARRKRQKNLDIRVIFGNPPYSVGQGDANNNNQNVAYAGLDERIRTTYAGRSQATNKNSLYDSYIRALRWASDRIGKSGIVGFVTNAGFVDANTADGLRKCLAEEYSSIYVFHLRGNQRTQGELSRREGGKIFGSGSRAPIAISILVKNPNARHQGRILFNDIGDYLNREEKLQKVVRYGSVAGITTTQGWQPIVPDSHGDWLKQRDGGFAEYIVLGDKDGVEAKKLFANYSSGVKTQRDAWCYNSSRAAVGSNIERMIAFYNKEVERFGKNHIGLDKKGREAVVDAYVDTDAAKISWSTSLKEELVKERQLEVETGSLVRSLYRPFAKQWLYSSRRLNERVYQTPRIFPDAQVENRVIILHGPGEILPFTVLMSDILPNLHTLHGGQCFPLYLYEASADSDGASQERLFDFSTDRSPKRSEGLTDEGLAHFREAYPGERIAKEDVFYYVYGLFHSTEYRERYGDTVKKELPRIPRVKGTHAFWDFSKAGRALGDLHVDYEKVAPHPVKLERSKTNLPVKQVYRVEKMRYGKKNVDGKNVDDKSVLIYNDFITLKDIPLEAYEYVVNGKPALEWVVERQCVKTDKDSGIVNDANHWANETMGDPKYPLELFQRVITVSLETMKIVKALPALELP